MKAETVAADNMEVILLIFAASRLRVTEGLVQSLTRSRGGREGRGEIVNSIAVDYPKSSRFSINPHCLPTILLKAHLSNHIPPRGPRSALSRVQIIAYRLEERLQRRCLPGDVGFGLLQGLEPPAAQGLGQPV